MGLRLKLPKNAKLLGKKQTLWILLSVLVAVIPHIPRLPLWFPVLLIAVCAVRWLVALDKIKPIPGLLVALFTVVLFITIIFFQGFNLNREISVTLLATMTVLKLLETWQKRDAWMIVMLCYFVILTRFFYSQDLLLVVYLFASVFIITHSLFVIQFDENKKVFVRSEIKQTLSLLAAGIPLAVLFFIFFPRLGSPIWGSPDLFGNGKTGMSEEMSPGSISQLFSDDSTAFRVIFFTPKPAAKHMYWRGPVLWDFDGKTWHINKDIKNSYRPVSFAQSGKYVGYEVELEPTGQKYLFALDYINDIPNGTHLLSDSQLHSLIKINQLRHYKLTSILRKYNPYENLNFSDRQRLLHLPAGFNPKTIQMMQQWKKQALTQQQYITKALNWFSADEFYYSYAPPLLRGNTVDEFLFGTKKGFCEHYASAFTVMMRALGIPARVVTGYQGGIQNDDYWLVKQSDAHAWSEVWIKNKGWLRVDPTAAVSPLRVEHGSQALMSQQSRSIIDYSWSRKLGEKYDAMKHKWNKWVRDYNPLKQQALFKIIGFSSQNGKSIAIILTVITVITTLFVVLFIYFTRPVKKLRPYDKVYNKFLKIIQAKDFTDNSQLGIKVLGEQSALKYPNARMAIGQFTELYLKLRYGQNHKDYKTLNKRLVRLLKTIKQKKMG